MGCLLQLQSEVAWDFCHLEDRLCPDAHSRWLPHRVGSCQGTQLGLLIRAITGDSQPWQSQGSEILYIAAVFLQNAHPKSSGERQMAFLPP